MILLSFAAGCSSAGQGSASAGTPAAGPSPAVDSAAYMPESDAPYVPADADFVRGMLVHHAQAIAMAALVDERTDTPAILSLARRSTPTWRASPRWSR